MTNRKTIEDSISPERIYFKLINDYSNGRLTNTQKKLFYRAVIVEVDTIGGQLEKAPPNPPGSVKARIYTNGLDSTIPNLALTVFYPIFPDHIRPPVEVDEHILVMFEDSYAMSNGLWITTVPAFRDVNFKDPEENRKIERTTTADIFEGASSLDKISEVNRDIEFGGSKEEKDLQNQVVQTFEGSDESFFKNKKVLHIGDSYVEGSYGSEFQTLVSEKGSSFYINESKINSNIISWLKNNKLNQTIQRYNPDVVLVTLGSKDYEIVNNPNYVADVKTFWNKIPSSIIKIWIGPPHPHGIISSEKSRIDKVINIIKQTSLPNFVDSRNFVNGVDKKSDGIDVTVQGGKNWASQVVNQIETNF